MKVWILAIALLGIVAVGCSGNAESKTTEKEKSNIDRFVKEGIKSNDMGGSKTNDKKDDKKKETKAPLGQPGNMPVDKP